MPLSTEVGFGPGDIVLDGDPAPPPPKRGTAPNFGPCLLWPNGWMDQDATWHRGMRRPRRQMREATVTDRGCYLALMTKLLFGVMLQQLGTSEAVFSFNGHQQRQHAVLSHPHTCTRTRMSCTWSQYDLYVVGQHAYCVN